MLSELAADPSVATLEDPLAINAFVQGPTTGSVSEMVLRYFTATTAYQRIFSANGKSLQATVYVRESDLKTLERLRALVARHCTPDQCYLANEMMSYVEFSEKIVPTLLESLAVSLLIVGILLVLLCRSLRVKSSSHIFSIVLSSLWGPVVMLGLLVVFGIKVNFVTCIFASVLVGLAGDNAIQFLFASKHRPIQHGVDARAGGALQISILMIGITLVFLASAFAASRTLGLLFCGGFFAAVFGDVWILRGLLLAFEKRRKSSAG